MANESSTEVKKVENRPQATGLKSQFVESVNKMEVRYLDDARVQIKFPDGNRWTGPLDALPPGVTVEALQAARDWSDPQVHQKPFEMDVVNEKNVTKEALKQTGGLEGADLESKTTAAQVEGSAPPGIPEPPKKPEHADPKAVADAQKPNK